MVAMFSDGATLLCRIDSALPVTPYGSSRGSPCAGSPPEPTDGGDNVLNIAIRFLYNHKTNIFLRHYSRVLVSLAPHKHPPTKKRIMVVGIRSIPHCTMSAMSRIQENGWYGSVLSHTAPATSPDIKHTVGSSR